MVKTLLKRMMVVLTQEDPYTWSEDYLLSLINQAQRKLAKYSMQTTTAVIDLDTGEDEVELPLDLLHLVTVYWGDGETRRELSPSTAHLPTDLVDEEDDEESGYPLSYYIQGKSLFIRPIPAEDGFVDVVYTVNPTEITDIVDELGDDVELHYDNSEDFIYLWAMRQYFIDQKDPYQARNWTSEVEESLMEWIHASENTNYTHPVVVKPNW